MKSKPASASASQMTELVLPNDTNILGKLMGGRLLYYMDIVSAMAAKRHSARVCVTASVDFVDFKSPVELGEFVVLYAKVTRAFTTSMEVSITVYAENAQLGEVRLTNTAFYTFVAIDQSGRPIPVNPIEPESDEEKANYEQALYRREMRLILAGKLKPELSQFPHLRGLQP
jgi:acyl-CoA hydrolase